MNTIDLLKSKGLKKTTQRVLLLDILQRNVAAITEEEVKQEMGDLYDRVTFYRMIQTLLDVNIIHRITIDSKTVKYALNDVSKSGDNHIHFFCRKCHTVTCLEGTIPDINSDLPKGYKEEEREVLIKGLCDHCIQ